MKGKGKRDKGQKVGRKTAFFCLKKSYFAFLESLRCVKKYDYLMIVVFMDVMFFEKWNFKQTTILFPIFVFFENFI